MKVLLTGGTGFIGRNVTEQLGGIYQVHSPTRDELELTNPDAVREYIKNAGFNAIVHCAGYPTHRAADTVADAGINNLKMFTSLMHAASKEGVKRFIHIGSGSEYDKNRDIISADERSFGKRIPSDITGYPHYLMNYLIEPGMEFVNLRCFGVFGKYEDYSIRFVSNAICRALYNYSITIRQNRLYSYIYIDDLVGLIDYMLKNKPRHKAYVVTNDEQLHLLDIARMVRRTLAKDVPLDIAKEGNGREYTGNSRRLKMETGIIFTSMFDAIRQLSDWYIMNSDIIDREKLLYNK